jgi:PAS domain S-box-containing protein
LKQSKTGVFARFRGGMKWSLGRIEAVAFIGGIFVVAAINVVSYLSTTSLISSGQRVTQTYQVLEKLQEVRTDLNDAATDQRNYVITGREAFHGGYRMALAELRRDVSDVRALVADNPEQQLRLDELQPTIEETIAELTGTLEARKAGGFDAAQERMRSGRGTRLMEAVHQSIDTMQRAEETLAKERNLTASTRAKTTVAAVTAGSVVAVLALLLAMYRINRSAAKRRAAEKALREAYDTLDVRVEQRTADLALVNTELRAEVAGRRRGEEQIREQAALLDHARDAISVRDLENRIRFWNKGAERIYGWTAEEAVGQKTALLLKLDQAQFDEARRTVLEKGSWSGEMRAVRKDGRPLIIEGHWNLVRDTQGEPKAILVIGTDVTEKKKVESQLLRAQRMESIGTLAGGIAHDLNNVLAPILMAIEILKRNVPDERSRRLFATLEKSAQRGADMVKQILTFARGVEGERMLLQPRHLLKDVEKIAAETFPKTIRLQTDAPSDLWSVSGDATQLHQVLLNLCVNARDAMPHGGVLSLGARNVDLDGDYAKVNVDAKPGPYVVLSVTDTGTGMPPAVMEKIFEPFFTTKEVGKGTGLGLSTSHAIVRSHGGFVHVYSEVGKGTAFKVYLPAVRAAADAAAVPARELPAGKGELILVVDDEASIREIAKETLESYGYRTLVAGDGAEALALFAEAKQDVRAVVTDMRMPFMDGMATIRALRKLVPAVKVIATSGLDQDGAEAAAGAGVIQAFLHKPYTAEKLLTTLERVLQADSPQ